jgi:hypothetical protein
MREVRRHSLEQRNHGVAFRFRVQHLDHVENKRFMVVQVSIFIFEMKRIGENCLA